MWAVNGLRKVALLPAFALSRDYKLRTEAIATEKSTVVVAISSL